MGRPACKRIHVYHTRTAVSEKIRGNKRWSLSSVLQVFFKDNLQCLSIPFKQSFFLTTLEEKMAGGFQKYRPLLVLRRLIKQCLQTQAIPWGLRTFGGCESIIDSSSGAGEMCDQCKARVWKVATHSGTWNSSSRTPFYCVHVCVFVLSDFKSVAV